jgi:small subunit ribosomal protein S20
MANIKSQIKRNRQNEAARVRNKSVRTALKSKARKLRTSVEAGDASAAQDQLRDVSRSLDIAAARGMIHKRRAADRKRRLARTVNKASQTS